MTGVFIKGGYLSKWSERRLCKNTQGDHHMNVEDWNKAYSSQETAKTANRSSEVR